MGSSSKIVSKSSNVFFHDKVKNSKKFFLSFYSLGTSLFGLSSIVKSVLASVNTEHEIKEVSL